MGRRALTTLFVLGLVGCSTMPPHAMTPSRAVSDMPVSRWELPNGLVVLYREETRAPLVAMEAVVKTGSATEGPLAGTGISHVVEHMLFKGTATRPVGAIERAITSYGGQINGHTTHDYTGYTLTVHRDHFQEALTLLADALQHPSFDAAELAKELEVVYRELKLRRDDPEQYTADLVWAAAYRVHPYRLPVIGYEPLVRALSRPQIVEYYRTHYLPNRTVVGLVGDVRPDVARAAVEQTFAAWPRGLEPPVVTPAEPPPVAPRVVEETADVALAQVVLAFPSVALTSPDLAALDTLAKVLGEGRGSRLDTALREPGLAHEVASWNYTPRDPGLFAVTLRLDPERIPEAVQATWDAVRQAQAQPVTAAELAAAQRAVVAQEVFGRQTVSAQAGDLAVNEALVGDPEFSAHYVARVQAVTAEDLMRVARRYLDPARVAQVIVRPRRAPARPPPAAAAVEEAAVERLTLRNGVRVLIREDHRLPIVSLRVTTLGGLLAEAPRTNGLSTLTARMLLRGTASRSAQELTDLVRSLGGSLSSASGRNSVGVSFELLSQDVVAGLEVLSDVWHHPAFPADEFLKEQRLLLAEIAYAEDDLFAWGSRRLIRALFPGHPYGFAPIGTEDTVRRLTVSDVAAFYRILGDPRQTVVTVFGDCRQADLLPVLERTFGHPAPAAGAALPSRAPAAPLTARQTVEEPWPRAEAIVLIGFRGMTVRAPDVVTMEVLEMILGGPAGRLFTEVRERRGQAYTVGLSASPGVDPGSIVLYAVTSPEQADAVVKTLLEQVERVRAARVPAEELAVAQRGLIGSRTIQWQTNSALGFQVGLDELYQVGWSAYRAYPAKVQAVTAEQVQWAARRYLTPEACVVFVGRPRTGAVPAATPAAHEVSR